jgi:hypothetical protein
MADLAKAKQTAEKLGQQPPAGITQGTPEYDNWVQQWFDAGVAAGDSRLIEANGGGGAGSSQAEEGGNISDWKNAAPSSEWIGKRKPTAQELRKWAIETGRSEDYKRFPDAAVSGWINSHWDVGKGIFVNNYGDSVDKPDERGPNTPAGVNGTGDKGGWTDGPGGDGGGGGGNAPAGPPPPPPPPVTFGNQLTMTGNLLQDMLIGQFNTGQDPSTYQNNIFGLGEDMKVGGAGNNADASEVRQGQSLSGGGLWWGQDKETFGGFDASTKNAEGAATASPAAPATPAPVTPTPVVPAPANPNGPSRQGGSHVAGPNNRGVATPAYQGFQTPQPKPTPIATMTSTQYNNPVRNKPSYF